MQLHRRLHKNKFPVQLLTYSNIHSIIPILVFGRLVFWAQREDLAVMQ